MPENLVSRDVFSRPVPRQPAHLHTQAESGAYLRCVMFGELIGRAGCVGGQVKWWIGCFLDDLRDFSINANLWTTATQDEGEWRKTAEQGAERFMEKWIAAEKVRAGLGYAVVPERDRKDQGDNSPKQAWSCWFACH